MVEPVGVQQYCTATWCNYILSILKVIEIPAVGGAAAHHV